MSDDELDAIRQRCDAASPAPWKSYVEGRDHWGGSSFIMTGQGETRMEDLEMAVPGSDQDFMAQARQDIPALLDEITNGKWVETDELAAMQLRCETATPGPWIAQIANRDHAGNESFIRNGVAKPEKSDWVVACGAADDLDFVAHAREDIPRLLEEVMRLRALRLKEKS